MRAACNAWPTTRHELNPWPLTNCVPRRSSTGMMRTASTDVAVLRRSAELRAVQRICPPQYSVLVIVEAHRDYTVSGATDHHGNVIATNHGDVAWARIVGLTAPRIERPRQRAARALDAGSRQDVVGAPRAIDPAPEPPRSNPGFTRPLLELNDAR